MFYIQSHTHTHARTHARMQSVNLIILIKLRKYKDQIYFIIHNAEEI